MGLFSVKTSQSFTLYFSMDYFSIKLDKNHQPINPKLCINTQIDYDYYMAVLNYLYQ